MLSTYDDLILFGDLVWGKYTSEFPTQDKSVIYNTPKYTHFAMRDLTADVQFSLATQHTSKSSNEYIENFL